MKYRTVARWNRSHQARTVSAAARELVAKLLDTAGPLDHRYADGRMVAVLFKGQRALAEEMGMSVSGIKARMRTLEKAGIIARHRRTQGRNSITVVELLTAPQPLKSQDSPRRTHPCPTVGHTLVPPTDTPLSESSSSGASSSDKSASDTYDRESSLSGVRDAAAGGKEGTTKAPATPPQRFTRKGVRDTLMELGVNPQTLLTMEKNHPGDVLAAVALVVKGFGIVRPNAKILKNAGAWIGSILLQGKPFDAYVRDVLEQLEDRNGNIAWSIEVLDTYGLMADTEYAVR